MDSFVSLAYASLAASRTFCNDFEFYFRFRSFILLLQRKKVISVNYGSSTSSWKPWRLMRLALILMVRDMYINSNMNPLTKFTSSSRSTGFNDILPWNISQMITKTVPISTRIVISYAMKRASRCEFDGKSMETKTTTWSEFRNGGKAISEQILASEERNKSKTAGLLESQFGIRVGKLTIWVRLCAIEKF